MAEGEIARTGSTSTRRQTVRAVAAILAVAWVVLPLVLGSGCWVEEWCYMFDDFVGVSPELSPGLWFVPSVSRATAGGGTLGLQVAPGTLAPGAAVVVVWDPPPGATGFTFPVQPTNPAGPPPFRFEGIQVQPYGASGPALEVSFQSSPGAPQGDTTFRVIAPSGRVYAVARPVGAAPEAEAVEAPPVLAATPEPYRWLRAETRTNFWGPLSSSYCQAMAARLQAGMYFFAVRYPAPPAASGGSHAVPFVLGGPEGSTLQLLNTAAGPPQSVAAIPLELAPRRHAFLNTHLPPAPGTYWAALAPAAAPAVDCPSSTVPTWELLTDVRLDYGATPQCGSCTFEVYVCYEGQGSPFTPSSGAGAASFVQADGITCAGPTTGTFGQASALELSGPGLMQWEAGHTVSFHHFIVNGSQSTLSVALSFTATNTLPWRFFSDRALTHEITGPLTVPAGMSEVWLAAPIPAGMSGSDHLTVTATTTTSPVLTATTTDLLWIGGWRPPGSPTPTPTPTPSTTSRWLPVASHAGGAQGSQWRTDMGVLNTSAREVTAQLRLHVPGDTRTSSLTVPGGGQVILADVVDRFAFVGSVPLEVVSSPDLIVTSRTYSLVGPAAACYPNGTLGQGYDSYAPADGLAAGQSAWLPQLVENTAFRSNIMLANIGASSAAATVGLFDGVAGQYVKGYTVTLEPGERKQADRPFASKAGRSSMAAGYAQVTVTAGAGVIALASVVDNATNDPTTILPVRGNGRPDQWIPVASHAAGALGSRWRTDLGALNLGTSDVVAQLRWYATSGMVTTDVTVPAGRQAILTDVVGLFPVSGSAAMEVVAATPLLVSSRTYNLVGAGAACYPNGTFGQSYEATTPAAGLGAGQSAFLPQLVQTPRYRSNIMVANLGPTPAAVTVELRDGDAGQLLATYQVSLAAGERKQEDQPFARLAGRTDLVSGYARVTVTSGAGVVAVGSVVDNATSDPTTVPMVR